MYGSLALEENSEVDEDILVSCSITCVCTLTFKPAAKEADQ